MNGHTNPVLLLAGLISLAAWLYLLLLHGRFWMVWRLRTSEAPVTSRVGVVCVVIPARNEADVIGRAVSSLLEQRIDGAVHVFVVDDDSTDGTSQAARAAVAHTSQNKTLTVIPGAPLRPGWSGKLWAMQQGVERALELHPGFLLLTDADVEHSPDSLCTLVATAESGPYDLASVMVRLRCDTVAEKLLIPAFVFFFFMLYPPEWIHNPRRRVAGAAGGSILIRPEALAHAGGIVTIHSEIIDDCALARAVKRCGGTVWLGISRDTQSLRSYGTFAGIERMIARTAFNQLRHSAWLLAGCIAGLALIFLLPAALLFSGKWLPALLGGAAWLLMTIAFLPMIRFYELNPIWAFTLPASTVFYGAATIHSAWKYWTGRGGEWKGRAQDVADMS